MRGGDRRRFNVKKHCEAIFNFTPTNDDENGDKKNVLFNFIYIKLVDPPPLP